ncbi:carboxypeptidase-like regulatory domain-containing protein [Olivibacter sitiensis]|uniref:carboxypeptidase-like regulatory domain-containing protein n=1 Tax=Olivibacter sitiensis TaxID=376470 RepID=UPI001FDF34C3|nr:carboxypeptidase-like regulatory domain-containing protein [Olivibacter sitiensis]
MKRILLLCVHVVFYMLLPFYGMSQQKRITGKVNSAEDNAPIPGVSVLVRGTTLGTKTDANGLFSIEVPMDTQQLEFSMIGYEKLSVTISGNVLDVTLSPDNTALDEVVVTALGIERKKNELAYAAQQVSGEEIVQARNNNFVSGLSGKVAGLYVNSNSTIGGSTNVVVRGFKSFTGNNQALFVIDGVPISNANINTSGQQSGGTGYDYGNAAADINPDDILSVNVLKGAAATALYGSRAANGVIMITTKKGKKNSLNVQVNTGLTVGKIDKSTYLTYQKEYGAGYTGEGSMWTADIDGDGVLDWVTSFTSDASMGTKFDPNKLVYQWNAFDPNSPYFGQATPWVAAQNDPTSFF